MSDETRRTTAEAVSAIFKLDGSQKEVFRVLARATEPMDVHEVSEKVGLHANSVRDALAGMVEAELVVSAPEQTKQRGRPRLLYEAVVKTDPSTVATELMNFSAAVADQIPQWSQAPTEVAHSIGASWADRIMKSSGIPEHANFPDIDLNDEDELDFHLGKLALVMSNMGFEARLGEKIGDICIYACPLLTGEVKGSHLVCQIHQGMMSQMLQRLSKGQLDAELEAFATPTHCKATIFQVEEAAATEDQIGRASCRERV